MEIKELEFNSVLDVASCFKDEKNIKFSLMKFFEIAHSINKKSDKKISELELAKVQVMFRKDTEGNAKNNLFLVHVLSYFDLVVPPKGGYFYLRILIERKKAIFLLILLG